VGWRLAMRCAECGWGRLYDPSETPARGYGPPPPGRLPLLCGRCGCPYLDDPRPGRRIVRARWWAPWTWGIPDHWEWRDDGVVKLPVRDAPPAALELIPGGKPDGEK
jgi:hypothetical protein